MAQHGEQADLLRAQGTGSRQGLISRFQVRAAVGWENFPSLPDPIIRTDAGAGVPADTYVFEIGVLHRDHGIRAGGGEAHLS